MIMKGKVCLLTFEYPPRAVGGLNTFVKLLEGCLVKKGVDVTVFLPAHRIPKELDTEIIDTFQISVNGGALTVSAHLMKGLTGKKNIILFSSKQTSALNLKRVYPGVKMHAKVALFAKSFFEYYKRNLKNEKILLHANDRQAGLAALLVKRRYPKVRLLYTIHLLGHEKGIEDMVPRKVLKDYGILKFIPKGIIERFIYKPKRKMLVLAKPTKKSKVRSPVWTEGIIAYYADKVNTVSRSYLRYAVLIPFKEKGILREKFTYVFNGMDIRGMTLKDFKLKKRVKAKLLKSLGLADGVLFLNTGRQNTGQKATDALCESIELFLEENPKVKDIRFIILAGGRNIDNKTKKILAGLEKKHRNYVRVITGWVDEILPYYVAADAYIMPSRFEPFGFTQIEAMCNGAPVIGSRTGGIRDVQIDYSGIADAKYNSFKRPTGMLVSIALPYDIADRILEMYDLIKNNPKLYKRLQRNSLERAKLFTIDKTADNYIKLYEELLKSA